VVKRRRAEKCDIPGRKCILTLLLAHPVSKWAEIVGHPVRKIMQFGKVKKAAEKKAEMTARFTRW
jgi:hypothetical protein